MLCTTQQRHIQATPEVTWRHLTDARIISEWFGDCESLALGEPFRFDFGDGDYFAGRVTDWEAPWRLGLTWKFMGLGNEYQIEFTLRSASDGTDVIVRDRGALSQSEADSLFEGWDDFLMRLEKRLISGAPARYRWTPAIGLGCLCALAPQAAQARLSDLRWWQAAFPLALCEFQNSDHQELRVMLREQAWGDHTTTARMTLSPFGDGALVSVSQVGFEALPEDVQVQERRRYAGHWEAALRDVEAWTVAQERR